MTCFLFFNKKNYIFLLFLKENNKYVIIAIKTHTPQSTGTETEPVWPLRGQELLKCEYLIKFVHI